MASSPFPAITESAKSSSITTNYHDKNVPKIY